MKKLFLILAAAALLAACTEDENTVLEGKWLGHTGTAMDSHHPLDITFNADTYIWHLGGYSPQKEEGTFTYENDIITLNGSSFWECEVDWSQSQQGGLPAESGAWVKVDLRYPTHKYKVLSLEADVLTLENLAEDMYPSGQKFVMTRGNAFPEESMLKGTWEGDSEGYSEGYGKKYRIKFDGKNFTRWEVYSQYGKIAEGGPDVTFKACIKEFGTWKYQGGVLTLTPDKRWNSYIVHANQYGTPLYNEVSTINETTLEASTWYEITGAELWNSVWALTKVGNTIYVEIKNTNMDYFIIEKK